MRLLLASLLSSTLIACSGTDDPQAPGNGPVTGTGGSSGSGGSGGAPGGSGGAPGGSGGSAGSNPFDLPPPEHGFQVEIRGTTINAGQDVEYCEAVQLPGN